MRTFGLETSKTINVGLKRDDLFSSHSTSTLLVFQEDLLKRTWKEKHLEQIRCGFSKLASKFEKNGVTRFVTALAPDKSSAYHPWLADPSALPQGKLSDLLVSFPVPDAHLYPVMAEAIALGARDVYLPNDTHWGAEGHQLAAKAVLDMLRREGLAR